MNPFILSLARSTLWMCALLTGFMINVASANEWPQELTVDGGTIVTYQPQPEALQGNTLTGRAAMSIEMDDAEEPIYGVFWFSSTIDTDRDKDLVTINDVHVTKVAWPDSKDTGEQRFTLVVENALKGASFEGSLAALGSALSTSEKVKHSLEDINNDPPIIIFSQQLSVLLLFDGKPIFKAVENSPYERALNTALAVVRDTRSKQYYLTSGSLWYETNDVMGEWQATTKPPADLVAMIPKLDEAAPAAIPAIVSATEPTELIVTSGKPKWTSLEGGKLLYVSNTETPWLRDLASGNMYLQLSGRWYRAKSQAGPWTFVRADKLPDGFKEIPPASDIGGVRSSVAGTEEANDAIADAHIPQTSAIKRSEAKLTVEYDGKPKFEGIKGTDVAYAVNTAKQVLKVNGKYYAVDEGVWFVSSAAQGPWVVADTIPSDKIAEIPPSSPMYNTTYVTVYDSTPDIVYVGYTPGYMWSYPYYGVPIYGTGWYYPPYYGNYYYPRAPTWGFHVGYNPWTGWNFGVSWGGPFFRVGVSWSGGYGHGYYPGYCCGGRYGGGYRHNDININTGDINIGNNVNIGNRNKLENGLSTNKRRDNIYNKDKNRHRNADRAALRDSGNKARSNTARKNDLYAGKNGQVARRSADDWQVRKDNKWQNVAREKTTNNNVVRDRPTSGDHARPAERSPSVNRPSSSNHKQFNHSSMNRDYHARQRGSRSGRAVRGGGRRR